MRAPRRQLLLAGLALAALVVLEGVAEANGVSRRDASFVESIRGAAIGPFLLPTAPMVAIVGLAVVEAVGAAGVALGAGSLQAGISYSAAARVWTVYLFGRTFAVLALVAADAVTLRSVVLAQAAFSLLCGAGGLLYAARKLRLPLRIARPQRIHVRRTLSYSATTGGFAVNEDSDKTLMVKLASSVDGPAVSVGQEIEIGWESRDAHLVRA